MKRSYGLLGGLTLVAMVCAQTACALTVVYVTTNGTGNGSSWVNATNSIQGAIDVIDDSNATNTVAVSNGVYDVGALDGFPTSVETTSNRVAIYKAITVRAASSDPADTLIVGATAIAGDPEFPNGTGAVRCVYMTNGASLIGFTLTNGFTVAVHGLGWGNPALRGGGVQSGDGNTTNSRDTVISNCVLVGNGAWYQGGGAAWGSLYDCTINYNTAGKSNLDAGGGAGAFRSNLHGCQINSNRNFLGNGGGVHGDTTTVVSNCYIAGNTTGTGLNDSAKGAGGIFGSFYSCTFTVNRAFGNGQSRAGGVGGQTDGGNVFDSVISGNTADNFSGVGEGVIASNCIIRDNFGRDSSAGGTGCVLIDCTVTGGSHDRGAAYGFAAGAYALRTTIISNKVTGGAPDGGGARSVVLTNCLIAYNSCTANTGGAIACTVVNCTVVDNTGSGGSVGGISGSTVINSISRDNTGADDSGNTTTYSDGVGAEYSSGTGNITDDPLFIDSAAGNFRLTVNSPCRNVGINQDWMTNAFDLDGLPRIISGTVDMGAYEEHMKPPPLTLIEIR